ncbi:CK1 family protein kinase [Tritrichomonas foetus]|uniref:non-specific serine/threonine protein kinase n=1 Tax=Tritrichomonas foetus TaxID=1144522 RepID=A0A1J4KYD4_9EUKA|nr:CK1 family protein kinase [Tritrichomonas foetus]|eukprot:OHT14718.1 CK1 family protein kinase [Tritrichomonas foetus]
MKPQTVNRDPKRGDRIFKFVFEKKIGGGGFGSVYKCSLVDNPKKKIALKIVSFKNISSVQNEKEIFDEVQKEKSQYFPRVYDVACCSLFIYIAMELLGSSLELLKDKKYKQKLCQETKKPFRHICLLTSIKMLNCIEALHKCKIIHRDIKPSNFLMRKDNSSSICLIDFGLAKFYMIDGSHIKEGWDSEVGTVLYQSIAAHEKRTLSRKDDLYSWFYSFIELLFGYLPWAKDKAFNADEIHLIKFQCEECDDDLCRGDPLLKDIHEKIKKMDFEAEPDYKGIIELITDAIRNPTDPSNETNDDDVVEDNCCNVC